MDRAVADLDAGLALDPKNSWALQRRASISLQKQHFGDAEKDLQTAASANPDDPTLAASRGLLALEKGDINGASAAFDVALARDAKNPAARFGRARVLLARGKVQESLSDLNALLGENPRNVEALAFRAQILNYRSDDAGARRDIDAALAIDPHNAWALAVRAAIAIDKKDYTTATDFVAKALAQDPNQSYARMLQATLLNRRGAGVSTESYDQAVAAAPNDPAPLVNRAIAHEEAKDLDAAAKDLAAALALDPGNPRALALQSEIARQKGDYTGAVKSLTAALVTSPQSGFLLSARAEVYRQMHEFDLALADTDAAMKAGLVSPELRLLRINILVSEGNATAATTEADKLVEENPTSDLAMVAAGKTYAAMGYPDKAMTAFDRAIAIHPESYIYLNRAQIRPHDDIAGKLADIDAALKIEPGQEDAIAEKAKILSRAGRNAEAIALYDSAIKAALDSSSLELLRAVALQRAGRTREAAAVFNAQRAKAKTVGDLDSLCSTKAISGVVLDSALLDCRRAEQMDANYPELNEVLGLVLLKLGKLPEALAAYDKAIASKSGAQSYLGRAIVHERMGDLSDAQADVAKARQLRPNLDDLAYDYGLKLDIPSPAKAVPASLPAKPK
jgi:tetratricopeptide (TPR) repeat protein